MISFTSNLLFGFSPRFALFLIADRKLISGTAVLVSDGG